MDWFNVFGYLAAACMVCGYMPQAVYTIRTRDTDGIALPTFLLMGLGAVFFIVQGLLSDPVNWPLVINIFRRFSEGFSRVAEGAMRAS